MSFIATTHVPTSQPAIGRIALIGNYLPRRCGIATFTHDLRGALARAKPGSDPMVVAMNDALGPYDYPSEVAFTIEEEDRSAYAAAADYLNVSNIDVVVVQHEFGIFGGAAGDYLLNLLGRLRMPVIATLHTVLTEPTADQRRVMDALVVRSSRLVVMAEKGREILRDIYNVPEDKIAVIPHGVPDQPFLDTALAKDALGFGDKEVLLTFGLLSPNKGIEHMLDAMPAIIEANPEALYVVLGATHPNLVRSEGERYRDQLNAQAARLGIAAHVQFIDGFVDEAMLLQYLTATDIYVTPYLHEAQITSGTLAISFGMGKPIVSTPYWHAKELLADDHGVLVPFADAPATASAIIRLLGDRSFRNLLRKRAYIAGRETIWPVVAERYEEIFRSSVSERMSRAENVLPLKAGVRAAGTLPRLSTLHLEAMTDSAGLLQHAVLSVADRQHGYCLDDNARALLFITEVQRHSRWSERETRLALTYAAFVEHAWSPERGRFANFMNYARDWLETVGADDAHGRAVWALGAVVERGGPRQLGDWATSLFLGAAPASIDLTSPRAWALAILGANAFLRRFSGHREVAKLRDRLSDRLKQRFTDASSHDWHWFEDHLAYDNARLCHAMIEAGAMTGDEQQLQAGLSTLEWLMMHQTAPGGWFRPVGSDSFGRTRLPPLPFDQQAIEVNATVTACLAAHAATGDERWAEEAHRAFAWFMGANDLRAMMCDVETGAGFDGLHPDRRNANQGAESTLAYLQSLSDMLALSARAGAGASLERVA